MTIRIDLPTTALEYIYAPAGVLKQSAGGAVCVDGDPIGEWQDYSANVRHVAQATAGAKPTWREFVTLLGMRPGVEASTDDVLFLDVGAILASINASTLYIVLFTSQTTTAVLVNERHVTNVNAVNQARLNTIVALSQGHINRDDAGTSMTSDIATSIQDGARHLFVAQRIASNSYAHYLDGVQKNTSATAPGTTTPDRFSILGALRATLGSPFTGTVGLIAGYSADNYATRFSSHGDRTISEIINDYFRRTTRRRRMAA